jgi:hypothetical protein
VCPLRCPPARPAAQGGRGRGRARAGGPAAQTGGLVREARRRSSAAAGCGWRGGCLGGLRATDPGRRSRARSGPGRRRGAERRRPRGYRLVQRRRQRRPSARPAAPAGRRAQRHAGDQAGGARRGRPGGCPSGRLASGADHGRADDGPGPRAAARQAAGRGTMCGLDAPRRRGCRAQGNREQRGSRFAGTAACTPATSSRTRPATPAAPGKPHLRSWPPLPRPLGRASPVSEEAPSPSPPHIHRQARRQRPSARPPPRCPRRRCRRHWSPRRRRRGCRRPPAIRAGPESPEAAARLLPPSPARAHGRGPHARPRRPPGLPRRLPRRTGPPRPLTP